eukprot:5969619-Prymnesium_polylepis.2
MAKGTLRSRTTAFVCPQRATCFVRCVSCIDKPFADAVFKVYKEVIQIPCNVSDTDAATARMSLGRVVGLGLEGANSGTLPRLLASLTASGVEGE